MHGTKPILSNRFHKQMDFERRRGGMLLLPVKFYRHFMIFCPLLEAKQRHDVVEMFVGEELFKVNDLFIPLANFSFFVCAWIIA